MDSKQTLRRKFRVRRDSLAIEPRQQNSALIVSRLLAMPATQAASSWFVYVATGSEVFTHDLIRTLLARSQVVAVPRVADANQMHAVQIHSFEELQIGRFGILEPSYSAPEIRAVDVMICPGSAFSVRGERLGTGGGFYDRYLAANSPRIAIGLAFECQIAKSLPVEAYDRPMDYVVTEQRILERVV